MNDIEIYICPRCGKIKKVELNTASPSMPRLDCCHPEGIYQMVKLTPTVKNLHDYR